ncbi:MAG: SH3 domain-containing protein, partial [Anaerolineae bacterium]|nr:SH3 domain-containing protein [Anaerolineae bacterium]
AWYVSDTKGQPAAPATTKPAPAIAANPASKPVSVNPSTTALPAGALAFLPIEELSFRSRPDVAPETRIRLIPVTEQLVSLEPANVVIPKVGVTGQWLKVRDATNKEGFVAAWYVKFAGGSTAQFAATTTTAAVLGGPLKVRAAAEQVALRKQPVVSDATLIKRVSLGTEFTVTEPNGEAKIGKNDQWLKVKDATGTEGYVAAWFVAR